MRRLSGASAVQVYHWVKVVFGRCNWPWRGALGRAGPCSWCGHEEASRLVAIYRTRRSIKFDRRNTEFNRQSQKAEGTRRSKQIQLADDVRTSNMKIEKGGISRTGMRL